MEHSAALQLYGNAGVSYTVDAMMRSDVELMLQVKAGDDESFNLLLQSLSNQNAIARESRRHQLATDQRLGAIEASASAEHSAVDRRLTATEGGVAELVQGRAARGRREQCLGNPARSRGRRPRDPRRSDGRGAEHP